MAGCQFKLPPLIHKYFTIVSFLRNVLLYPGIFLLESRCQLYFWYSAIMTVVYYIWINNILIYIILLLVFKCKDLIRSQVRAHLHQTICCILFPLSSPCRASHSGILKKCTWNSSNYILKKWKNSLPTFFTLQLRHYLGQEGCTYFGSWSHQKTSQWIAIKGSNVTLITDAKSPSRQSHCLYKIWGNINWWE